VSLLLTYYYIKQCLTYHLDRTRQWSKLETLVSKWSTLYGTPFLSSEVTVLCWCLHMTLYTPVTISNFIDHCHNYVFACLNKKSKIDQEFANCCEISLSIFFFIFFCYYICFVRGRMVVGFPLPMQSVLITSELWDRTPLMARCAWYNIVW
jgi:hypothetical protein